jgi:hypothetical protein
MKKKLVSYTMETLPRTSPEEVAKLVAVRPEKIDTSDISEWTEEQWKSAERGRMYRPSKSQTVVDLTAE